jgi:hypothetical protein
VSRSRFVWSRLDESDGRGCPPTLKRVGFFADGKRLFARSLEMALKLDVRVPVQGAVELGAWLFLPEEDGLHPAVTVATALRGPRNTASSVSPSHSLRPVLSRQFTIIAISGQVTRGDTDPWLQIADRRRAISYVDSQHPSARELMSAERPESSRFTSAPRPPPHLVFDRSCRSNTSLLFLDRGPQPGKSPGGIGAAAARRRRRIPSIV